MTDTETSETTKIVLVEDDLTYAHILTISLKEEADFRVLGCFHSVEEALEDSCSWEDADCALIDLELPGASGNQLVRHLSKAQPTMKTVVLTAYQDSHAALQAIQYGAQGYIMKDLPLREILRELRSLRSGGTPLDSRAAKVLMAHLRLDQDRDRIAVFSKRETEILGFINAGLQYKEIAGRLNVSPHTVHSHIKRIYRRLQVSDRRSALQKVRLLGIIDH
jgi:two-component system NarL family response regulator